MVFHRSLSDSKSPQVSRTLLSILAVLNNAVVWMVSTRPPTSKSSSSFSNPLVTVPNAPITIGIIITCMFHSFFSSLARSRYLSFFSHSFSFILWSAGTAKSTILQVLFYLLIIIKSSLMLSLTRERHESIFYFTRPLVLEIGKLISKKLNLKRRNKFLKHPWFIAKHILNRVQFFNDC